MSEQPCAWDSVTAYLYCYRHDAWTDSIYQPCPGKDGDGDE